MFSPVITRNYFDLKKLVFSDEQKSMINIFVKGEKKFFYTVGLGDLLFQTNTKICSSDKLVFHGKYKKFFPSVEKNFWERISLVRCTRFVHLRLLSSKAGTNELELHYLKGRSGGRRRIPDFSVTMNLISIFTKNIVFKYSHPLVLNKCVTADFDFKTSISFSY